MNASQLPVADTTVTSQVPAAGATPSVDAEVVGGWPVFLENAMVLVHLQAAWCKQHQHKRKNTQWWG